MEWKKFLNDWHEHPIAITLSLFFAIAAIAAYFIKPTSNYWFFFLSATSLMATFYLLQIKLAEKKIGVSILLMTATAVPLILSYAMYYIQTGIFFGDNDSISHNHFETLYFSIVTWTTLGYGDFRPVESARFIAASEALLGYIYMGVFVGLVLAYTNSKRESQDNKFRGLIVDNIVSGLIYNLHWLASDLNRNVILDQSELIGSNAVKSKRTQIQKLSAAFNGKITLGDSSFLAKDFITFVKDQRDVIISSINVVSIISPQSLPWWKLFVDNLLRIDKELSEKELIGRVLDALNFLNCFLETYEKDQGLI